MGDFQNFLTKGADFYLVAPSFFNWAAPIVVATIGGLIWLAYWFGGKFADSEINGQLAHIAALDQRVSFAKEQAELSTKEATDLRGQLDKLKSQIKARAPLLEIQDSTTLIEGNVFRIIGANTAAAESLGHVSTGFDGQGRLKWRPIRPDEADELLGPKK